MTLWLIVAVMVAAATAAVLVPLVVRHREPASRAAHDLEIYRDQIAEVERDHTRGLISDEQAEAARAEIGRRALAAGAGEGGAEAGSAAGSRPRPRKVGLAAALGVIVPAAAIGLYGATGSPDLPGMPASERLAALPDGTGGTDGPSPEHPSGGATAGMPDMATAVAQLAERLRSDPDNLEGWRLLARSLTTLQRYAEAADAYAQLASRLPDDSEIRSLYGESLIAANKGTVTAAARLAFAEALRRDEKDPRARFYLGLAALQAGDEAEALQRWRSLEAESKPEAPWLPMLRERIAQLEGRPPPERTQPPAEGQAQAQAETSRPGEAAASGPGPTRDDVRAASEMSAEDRMEMIRGMVARLAERLKEEPDDAKGWARLARSYNVLGEKKKAREALEQVVKLRPNDVGALTAYAESLLETAEGPPPPAFGKTIGSILRLDPNNQPALWIAGLVAQQSGAVDEARRYWTRLDTLLPEGSREKSELQSRIDALGKPD